MEKQGPRWTIWDTHLGLATNSRRRRGARRRLEPHARRPAPGARRPAGSCAAAPRGIALPRRFPRRQVRLIPAPGTRLYSCACARRARTRAVAGRVPPFLGPTGRPIPWAGAVRASWAQRRAFAGGSVQKRRCAPACSFSITPRKIAWRAPGARACLPAGAPYDVTRRCAECCRSADAGLVGGTGNVAPREHFQISSASGTACKGCLVMASSVGEGSGFSVDV
jgi:hypothetical protein